MQVLVKIKTAIMVGISIPTNQSIPNSGNKLSNTLTGSSQGYSHSMASGSDIHVSMNIITAQPEVKS